MNKIKAWLIIALLIDAAIVFILQIAKVNAWLLICLYWLILTIKNLCDVKE